MIQSNWFEWRRNQASWGNYWVTIHVFPTNLKDQFVADLNEEADGKPTVKYR